MVSRGFYLQPGYGLLEHQYKYQFQPYSRKVAYQLEILLLWVLKELENG